MVQQTLHYPLPASQDESVRQLLLIFFLVLTFTAEAYAQSPGVEYARQVTFERIQFPGGGSENGVIAIAQDTSGFMWFGGGEGLYRYDGYEAINYEHDSSDSTSIAANWVEAVYVDRRGTLWVGTYYGGLSRFDPITGTFVHFLPDPNDPESLSYNLVQVIYEDAEGEFWIGTQGGGLDRMDRESGRFIHYRHDPADSTSISDDNVRVLFEDSAGNFWVGTWFGGLNLMDRESGTFIRYQHDPLDPGGLADNQVNAIREDSEGNLWIGTRGDGLHTLDRGAGRIIRHGYDPANPNEPSAPQLIHSEIIDPFFAGVRFIHEDGRGNRWIGGFQGGLDYYDRRTGEKVHYESTPNNPQGPGTNNIWAFFESRDGTLWLGTWEGLYKITVSPVAHIGSEWFDGSSVSSLFEDREGMLWIGTWTQGIVRLELGTGLSWHYEYNPDEPYSFAPGTVNVIREDHEGKLWVGNGSGLNRYDRHTNAFTQYIGALIDPALIRSSWITTLHVHSPDRLWVGTYEAGVSLFNAATDSVARFRHDADDPNSLSDDNIFALLEDSDGMLWIGTQGGGLDRLDPQTGEITHFVYEPEDSTSLNQNRVVALHEDQSGAIWVGTSKGLHRFNPETASFTRFTTANSDLPEDRIQGIVDDAAGNLWIATSGDLTQFNPASNTTRAFRDLKAAPFNPRTLQIVKHGKRADQIVNSMMQHARESTGERYRVEVNSFIDDCFNVSYHGRKVQLPYLKVMIEREYDEHVGTLEMAPQEMSRVMQNLLNNAFEAVHERAVNTNAVYEPKVSVSTLRNKDGVEIQVRDNGNGIPDDIKSRVFEPFFTTKPTGSGTGLGLSLSFDIVVKGHGGSLTVVSEEGEGATFVITLPVKGE